MKLSENVAKFSKFVKAHPDELSPQIVQDVARAIVLSDIRGRVDAGRGQFEHVTLAGLAACGISEFSGVSRGGSRATALSDVMQMRIMCDVLTIVMGGNYKLAMRYSSRVAQAVGQRRVVGTYLSYEECEAILNGHCASGLDEELRPVFEQTSELLEGLHQVQLVADKEKLVVTSTCVKGVWLPEDYKSAGFEVSTKIPSNLKAADGDKVALVAMHNFACIMDVLVRAITRTRTGSTACSLFVARIDEMCSLSKDLVPIGIKVTMGVHPSVYRPNHFIINDTIKVMYRRLFTDDVPISVESVRNTIQVILRYYKARNGGV